jgi:hypothetical protein
MINRKAWKHTLSFMLALALTGSIVPSDIYASPENNASQFPESSLTENNNNNNNGFENENLPENNINNNNGFENENLPENNNNGFSDGNSPANNMRTGVFINGQEIPENSEENIIWFSQIWSFEINSEKQNEYFVYYNSELTDLQNIMPYELQDGIYNVQLFAKRNEIKYYYFGLDTVKPEIQSVLYNTQNNSVKFTASDTGSGIDKYCINGTDRYVDADSYGIAYNVTDAGAATVIDKAGNIGDYVTPQTFSLDINTNGYIFSDTVPSSQTVTLTPSLSGNGTYSEYKFQYSTDGGISWYEITDGNIYVSDTDGIKEYTVRAVCTDGSDFEICRNSTQVNVDTIAPENAQITINGEKDSQGVYITVPSIEITAPSSDKTVYKWDGTEYTIPTGTTAVIPAESITDGKHTLSVTVTDSAGNIASSEVQEINVNAVMPEVTAVSVNSSYRIDESGKTVYCKDKLSFTVSVNSETVSIIPVSYGNEINASEYTSDGNTFTLNNDVIFKGKAGFKVTDAQNTEKIYYIENVIPVSSETLNAVPSLSDDNAYTFIYDNSVLEMPEINVKYKDKNEKSHTVIYNKNTSDNATPWTNEDITVTFSKTNEKEYMYQYKKAEDTQWIDYNGNITISEKGIYNFRSVSESGVFSEELTADFRIFRDIPAAESVHITEYTSTGVSEWYNDITLEVKNNTFKDDSTPVVYTYCEVYKKDYSGKRKLGYAVISDSGQIDIYDENKTEKLSSIVQSENQGNKFTISLNTTGEYELRHWTEDETGNSTDVTSDIFYVETENPVINYTDIYGRNILKEKSLFFVSAELSELFSGIDFGYSGPADENAVVYEYKSMLSDQWKPCNNVNIYNNDKYNIRITATNKAGLSSQSVSSVIVIDSRVPAGENNVPEITMKNSGIIHNGIYSSNVDVEIIAVDPLENNSCSGLNNVIYWIDNNETGQTVAEGVLFSYDLSTYNSPDDLQSYFSGSIQIPASLNSNDITLYVQAEDNVGNIKVSSENVSIDTIAPAVNVKYSDDAPVNGIYNKRTATITINEKNFNADDVHIVINGSETGVKWSSSGTIHTANVQFTEDGEYTFDISYTDLAGNEAVITYDGEQPNKFTVDNTAPELTISYDNNASTNGCYYSKSRTATITVKDKHLNSQEFMKHIHITHDGTDISAEVIKINSPSENTYVYTVPFISDGRYSLSIDASASDEAGNVIGERIKAMVDSSFVVDTCMPEISISGVADKSANKDSVVPVINYSDINADSGQLSIKLTDAENNEVKAICELRTENSNGSVVKTPVENNSYPMTSAVSHQIFITNFEELSLDDDNFYTLTASITDNAGNVSETSIEFSINRTGPVYVVDHELDDYLNKHNQQTTNIKVMVYDVNSITNTDIDIIKDGNKISTINAISNGNIEYDENKFTVAEHTPTKDENRYAYEYVINEINFKSNGNYNVIVTATDEASNSSDNTVTTYAYEYKSDKDVMEKSAEIKFTIDNIPPDIIFDNLASNAKYNTDNKTVSFILEDNISTLSENDVEIYVNDQKADIIASDDTYKFNIASSDSPQKVYVKCVDQAGNINEMTFNNILITSDTFQLYRRQIIAGIVALSAVIISVAVLTVGKKKNNRKKLSQ